MFCPGLPFPLCKSKQRTVLSILQGDVNVIKVKQTHVSLCLIKHSTKHYQVSSTLSQTLKIGEQFL